MKITNKTYDTAMAMHRENKLLIDIVKDSPKGSKARQYVARVIKGNRRQWSCITY